MTQAMLGQLTFPRLAAQSGTDSTLPLLLALIALVGPVIAAGATLMGIRITQRHEQRRDQEDRERERERWRIDQRVAAYADMVRGADDFRKAARDLYVAEPSEPNYRAVEQAFEDQSHLLDRAASRVSLVGSKDVQEPLNALTLHALLEVSARTVRRPQVSVEEWDAATTRFFELYDAFLDAARRDLGLPPLKDPRSMGPTAP